VAAPRSQYVAISLVSRRRARELCLAGAVLLLAGLAWVGGCRSDDVVGSTASKVLPPVLAPVVSNPVAALAGVQVRTAYDFHAATRAATSGAEVAYVSLPSGTIPQGELAVIRNLRTGVETAGAMASGGLDPVPIEATSGDSLTLDAELVGGGHRLLGFRVPLQLAPRVVRTHPAHGKRDLALNVGVLVVFSEPVDPGSIGGVHLLDEGAPVAGKAELSPDGLRVTFQPSQLLAPNTLYVLSISSAVKDLSGEALDQPVAAAFTTGTTVVSASIVTEQAALFTNAVNGQLLNGQLRTFQMNAIRDTAGQVTGTFDIFYPGNGSEWTGPIDCFTIVDDSTAWVAGTFQTSPDPTMIGEQEGWRIVDHGSPAGGVPDQLSLSWSLAAESLGTAQDFCSKTPTVSLADGPILLYDLTSGDIVISGGTGVHSPPPPPPPSAGTSQIAFAAVSTRGLLSEGINVMSADLSFVRALTTTPSDFRPAWSPDGLRLAFESERGHPGDGDIYVMSYDGSGVRQLTGDASDDREPAWSPDGRTIAFYRRGTITLMNAADGSGVAGIANGAHPAWSPDGHRLAFAGANGHLWLVNPDGSGLTELTTGTVFDDTPAWSPDGRRLAFQRTPVGSTTGAIYLMNADGSGITQLTLGGQTPSWAPDGTMIVFENLGINMINADGTGLTRLGPGFTPAWSPVGIMPPRPQAPAP